MRKGLLFAKRSFNIAKRTFISRLFSYFNDYLRLFIIFYLQYISGDVQCSVLGVIFYENGSRIG